MSEEKVTAIIPCAGFGTRMGMRPDQAKELLLDDNGIPMIQWCIDLCDRHDLSPNFVVRPEKKDLVQYIVDRKRLSITWSYPPHGEWPMSVLSGIWHKHNILILPDTRFDNADEAIEKVKQHLFLGASTVLGVHQVPDPQKWGIVEDYRVFEKPAAPKSNTAWGIIGFERSRYMSGFFWDLETRKWTFLQNTSFVDLINFRDITRVPSSIG